MPMAQPLLDLLLLRVLGALDQGLDTGAGEPTGRHAVLEEDVELRVCAALGLGCEYS